MKRCRDCGEEKPFAEFNRAGAYLNSYCKPCHRARAKAWQQGPGKERHEDAVKRWRTGTGREAVASKDRQRRESDPLKWKARRAVREAVIAGRLVRPEACPACGDSARQIHAHHHRGYEPDAWLDIKWLCTACHALAHREAA